MPPKLKEDTVRGFCAKMKNPPKGVGGAIVQSLELKRNVTQSKRGNKVFERAIEERQTSPGVSTTRVGTKIYYFDNDPSPLHSTMDSINQELSAKCDEMDELDASLAENELKMAKLDAELEKLDIIGDEAIEDATITETEDLDLLLVPSIQNLIFRVYNESGIKLPPPGEEGRAEGELKAICKEFCKAEFNRLEREKGVNSPCIALSDASDGGARNPCRHGAQKNPPSQPPSKRPKPCPPVVKEYPFRSIPNKEPRQRQEKQPAPPQPSKRAMPKRSQPKIVNPPPPCRQAGRRPMVGGEHLPRAHAPSPRPPKNDQLAECMDDCEQNFGKRPPQNRLPPKPAHRPQPPQPPPMVTRPPAIRERPRMPARPLALPAPPAPPASAAPHSMSLDEQLAACIDNCEANFGKKPKVEEPQDLAGCFAQCELMYGEKPKPPRPPPPPPPPPPKRTLEDCIRDCEKRFAKPIIKKPIIPRPPLFSRIVNGKRCFPDLAEIPKKDQTLYMAERDAYVLFRRQFADRGNEITFFEKPNEFEEYFFNYINGTTKINVPICPPAPPAAPKPIPKTPSDELVQSFVELQKIELDTVLQRNVLDLALDRPDRDPEVIALLMNERLPLWVDPLIMSELAVPYPLHKRLFATDVRHTAPGSMVPRTIPVQALNLMNTHVMEGVEAIIKSNEYVYPTDNIASKEIADVAILKPERDPNAPVEPPPENYNCVIELHPFRVETFFQLRGANVPLWYPGMFTAFPDGRSSIKLVSTPSALINTAWRMCAP